MNELQRKVQAMFPNAKEAFRLRNPDIFGALDMGEAQNAKPQPVVCPEPMGPLSREEKNTACFLVRLTSYRKRLLDPDNLCPKYFIDCLRYSGLIPDDRPEDIQIEVHQAKTIGKEGVIIRIERI